MSSDLRQLIEQQQQTNRAILALLNDGPREEPPVVATRSLGEEMDQNHRLCLIRETQGVEAWRVAHNAVMAERKAKMRHASRRR